jgi:hypothetical protein
MKFMVNVFPKIIELYHKKKPFARQRAVKYSSGYLIPLVFLFSPGAACTCS